MFYSISWYSSAGRLCRVEPIEATEITHWVSCILDDYPDCFIERYHK